MIEMAILLARLTFSVVAAVLLIYAALERW